MGTDTEPPDEARDAFVASPVEQSESSSLPAGLTPLRAHYLKKSLIQLQLNQEIETILNAAPNNESTLSYLGPPFSPPPKGSSPLDLPFLRYIFRQFVLTFPFMAAAPKDFYSEKLQPFVASMLSRNLSPNYDILDEGADGAEQAARTKMLGKLERSLSTFLGTSTKLVEREEVVRLTQTDLDRLEMLAKKRQARLAKNKDIFEVNIVGVRTVLAKGRVRNRSHDEFIIRTRRSRYRDVFVARRYGDFKTLATELRKAHHDEDVPSPPVKDRSTVSIPPSTPSPSSLYTSFSGTSQQPPNILSSPSDDSLQSFGSPVSPTMRSPLSSQQGMPSRLSREKNRLTLRAYLHTLMTSKVIASSPVLRSFLLSGPTTLTADELEDARRREEADQLREEGRKRFAKEIAHRVDGLRNAIRSVKGDIMGENGLTHVFGTIKVTPNVRDLPPNYQAVLEWARISLASTVFHQFIASDSSSETFASLKRIHGLMPYMLMKGALKISNPIGMIRGVLDLFLAQPFGGKSLLQRMFTSSLTEEVKVLEEQIEAVKDKVEDPIICEKMRQFVYAPKEIQDLYKIDAAAENQGLITIILRSGEEPLLNRAQMHRVAKAHRAHEAHLRKKATVADSDDDFAPEDEDAWLYEDLRILAQLYARLRDREQLIGLIFEGFTADLLKDIITIFYSPLAQVYKAASIGDSLNDLQSFINDLIKTVEAVEEIGQDDPQRTVQTFIDLIQRHEQAFYHFVHKVHSKGEGLFDSLMRWIELFLTVVREGLGLPLSLEFLLPHTEREREEILVEVDKVALHHYKLKVIYEDKLRRRFGRTQNGGDAEAEDEATQNLVNGLVGGISFGELAQSDGELGVDTDDSSEEDSSEYDTASDDDSSSESSSDSPPETNARPTPTRSSTIRPNVRTPEVAAVPPKMSRVRSMSLKLSRSMSSLKGEAPSRKSHDQTPPPPVPKNPLVTALSKPLPPSPSRSSTDSVPPPKPLPPLLSRSPAASTPSPPPPPIKKNKTNQAPQPPSLEHIPKLLPVFVEMVSCSLSSAPFTRNMSSLNHQLLKHGLVNLPRASPAVKTTVEELLFKDAEEHHCYFRSSGVHNHLSHHLLAAYDLGASEGVLRKIYEEEAKIQRPIFLDESNKGAVITDENLAQYLGNQNAYGAFCQFFRKRVSDLGAIPAVEKYIFSATANEGNKAMVQRLAAGALHPFIQIGHGIEFGNPILVATGLAQAAVHTIRFQPVFSGVAESGLSMLEILRQVYDSPVLQPVMPYDNNALINTRMKTALTEGRAEEIQRICSQMKLDNLSDDDYNAKVNEIIWTSTLLMFATRKPGKKPRLDFFLMHLVTSSIFLKSYVNSLQVASHKADLIRTYVFTMILLLLSRGRPIIKPDLVMTYTDKPRPPNSRTSSYYRADGNSLGNPLEDADYNPWPALITSALHAPDCHVLKTMRTLVYAAREFGDTLPGGVAGAFLRDDAHGESHPGSSQLDGSLFVRAAGMTLDYMGWVVHGQPAREDWDRSALGWDDAWLDEV
ncbi:hypothetical protein EYR36_006406 [Pleurotus pulmonarius]|nr:hypothetical protein EYR36_006406 [Pleurotus pulmonarius]